MSSERSSMNLDYALLRAYLLSWLSSHYDHYNREGLELLKMICASLATQIKISLTRSTTIAGGHDLVLDSLEDVLVCTLNESTVGCTILAPQYRHKRWKRGCYMYLVPPGQPRHEVRSLCLRKSGADGVRHCDNCLCAIVYQGVPEYVLYVFGFGRRTSKEWRRFVLTMDWTCAFGAMGPAPVIRETGVRVFQPVIQKMLKRALSFICSAGLSQCFSTEQLMLNWDKWRRWLFFVITLSAAIDFGIFASTHNRSQQPNDARLKDSCGLFYRLMKSLGVMRAREAWVEGIPTSERCKQRWELSREKPRKASGYLRRYTKHSSPASQVVPGPIPSVLNILRPSCRNR